MPWACLAAPWFDLVTTLPSVHAQGGPSPVFAAHPLARDADPETVTRAPGALTGFLVHRRRQPALRACTRSAPFQRALGRASLDRLPHRMESSP
ncbi:hypothetical protein ACN3XK_27275 [Actinomadura welshii]